jgi:1-deoxy-D-xylulose-5-phosphate synthase
MLQGGFGSAVLELFQSKGLFSVQIRRVGIPDTFIENGPQSLLRKKYGIDREGIVQEAVTFLEKRRGAAKAASRW